MTQPAKPHNKASKKKAEKRDRAKQQTADSRLRGQGNRAQSVKIKVGGVTAAGAPSRKRPGL